ncbi:MAG: hypothetical protein AAB554_04570 [Patescibacteria group bacterium]
MTKDAAVQEPPRSLQLHPSRSLHRPDKDGQMRHVFLTLTGDIPLAELTLDDILEVNWNGVKTSIKDAIVRVRHEGDLTSTTVRDTIRLLALVLRKLDVADGEIGQRLEATPGIGFWGWILSLLPTEGSRRLRAISGERGRLKRKRRELDEHHDEIFEMRIELAGEIDKKLGAMLASKDPEYRGLLEQLQAFQAVRTAAKSILNDLASLEELEVTLVDPDDGTSTDVLDQKIGQITSKIPSFIAFCQRHEGMHVKKRGDVELFVRELSADLDARAVPLEQVMQAKRESWKQELYAEAVDQP